MSGNGTSEAATFETGAADWYVTRDGAAAGPMSQQVLRERLQSGDILPTDLLWCQSLPHWVEAAAVMPSLLSRTASTPAVATPAPTATARPAPAGAAPGAPSSRLQVSSAIVFVVLVLTLVGLSLASCMQFLAEGGVPLETYALKDADKSNALTLNVQIMEANLVREQLRLYVTPRLTGSLAQGSPRLPSREIELTMASVGGPRVITLKRDHHAEPFELDVPLAEGHIQLYPMDRYAAWIEAEALATEGGEHVPVVMELNLRNHAVHVTSRLAQESETGDLVVRLAIERLLPVVVFTWFMAGVAAVISMTVVLVVVSVMTKRRKPDLGMLGWCTALLFALPAVRNNLPAAPPLGALIDYSVFFWAEALVGLSMLVLVALWYSHREQAA